VSKCSLTRRAAYVVSTFIVSASRYHHGIVCAGTGLDGATAGSPMIAVFYGRSAVEQTFCN
jgi:hypothetical protein